MKLILVVGLWHADKACSCMQGGRTLVNFMLGDLHILFQIKYVHGACDLTCIDWPTISEICPRLFSFSYAYSNLFVSPYMLVESIKYFPLIDLSPFLVSTCCK